VVDLTTPVATAIFILVLLLDEVLDSLGTVIGEATMCITSFRRVIATRVPRVAVDLATTLHVLEVLGHAADLDHTSVDVLITRNDLKNIQAVVGSDPDTRGSMDLIHTEDGDTILTAIGRTSPANLKVNLLQERVSETSLGIGHGVLVVLGHISLLKTVSKVLTNRGQRKQKVFKKVG